MTLLELEIYQLRNVPCLLPDSDGDHVQNCDNIDGTADCEFLDDLGEAARLRAEDRDKRWTDEGKLK